MDGIDLNRSELLCLMDLMGIDELMGMDPGQLTQPDELEHQESLREGLDNLTERELLTVNDQEYEIDESVRQMVEIMAQPEVIVRTYRETPGENEYWSWYFVSGSSIVEISMDNPGQFQLATVPDLNTVLEHLEVVFPLTPVPDTVRYNAEVPQDDAKEVTWLANGWDEVPALNILEADGLNTAEAMDLFDDIAEFAWWGKVDLMACQGNEITAKHRVLAIQGQERSWVARQTKADESTIHIHTALSGDFKQLLELYLNEISP